MDKLNKRFEQGGGLYHYSKKSEVNSNLEGGGEKLSPKSDNWKKKYLEIQIELRELKKENQKLKHKNEQLEQKIRKKN